MNIISAFSNGLRATGATKKYILLAYILNFLLVAGLAASVANSIGSSVGSSQAGENLRLGFDDTWFQNYSVNQKDLAATFSPSVTGMGAIFNGLDQFLRGGIFENFPSIVAAGFLYLLLWTFLSAGFITVYASDGEKPSFFQQAAHFFPRFLVLAVLAGILYYFIFGFVTSWLDSGVRSLTRETLDERVHFTYVVIEYAIVWMMIVSVNLIFDYSKIMLVLSQSKSVFMVPVRSAALVFSNFRKTFGLYALIGIAGIVLMLVYWLIVPGAKTSTWFTIVGAFLIGQVYLLARIWMRCLFFAGQTTMGKVLV